MPPVSHSWVNEPRFGKSRFQPACCMDRSLQQAQRGHAKLPRVFVLNPRIPLGAGGSPHHRRGTLRLRPSYVIATGFRTPRALGLC